MTMHVSNLAATPATLTWDCVQPAGKRGTYSPRGYCGLGHDLVDARNGTDDEPPVRRGRKPREVEPPAPAEPRPDVVAVVRKDTNGSVRVVAAVPELAEALGLTPPPAEEPHDPWCGLRGCKLPCGQASTREAMSGDPAAPLTADWPEPIDYDGRTAIGLPVHGEPLPNPDHATPEQVAQVAAELIERVRELAASPVEPQIVLPLEEAIEVFNLTPDEVAEVRAKTDLSEPAVPEVKARSAVQDRRGRKGDRGGARLPPPQTLRHYPDRR